MSKQNKCTNGEMNERINKVYQLIIDGFNRRDICRYVSKNTDWDIGNRQVDEYIKKANDIIIEHATETRDEFYKKCQNRFLDLYKKAMSMKDIGECRRILETWNKVLGYEKLTIDQDIKIVIKEKEKNLDKQDII